MHVQEGSVETSSAVFAQTFVVDKAEHYKTDNEFAESKCRPCRLIQDDGSAAVHVFMINS